MYSIDTSALVDGWVRDYPPGTFIKLWEHDEELIIGGELRASKEVLVELEPRDDELYLWAQKHPKLFVEIDDPVQHCVAHLMANYYNPAKPHKGISGADPFVIALAMTKNPFWTVVSGEHPGSRQNPKIPYVCSTERVPHASFLGLIQAKGWTF